MAVPQRLLSAILISTFAVSASSADSEQLTCLSRRSDGSSLSCELQDLKLKVAQLGIVILIRFAKSDYLEFVRGI